MGVLSVRNEGILTMFCLGEPPSSIDRAIGCESGESRRVVVDWWESDKLYRDGGIDYVLGSAWAERVAGHRSRK